MKKGKNEARYSYARWRKGGQGQYFAGRVQRVFRRCRDRPDGRCGVYRRHERFRRGNSRGGWPFFFFPGWAPKGITKTENPTSQTEKTTTKTGKSQQTRAKIIY